MFSNRNTLKSIISLVSTSVPEAISRTIILCQADPMLRELNALKLNCRSITDCSKHNNALKCMSPDIISKGKYFTGLLADCTDSVSSAMGTIYTLPQKKRNFSGVAFLFGKSVHHLILDQKSFVECSW